MNVAIRKLTADMLDDYLIYFDSYEDCYCVCYASDNQVSKRYYSPIPQKK